MRRFFAEVFDNFRFIVGSLVLTGLIILALITPIWWRNYYQNPERVFWQSIENSLSVYSVTYQTETDQPNTNLVQTSQLSFPGKAYVRSLLEINETADNGDYQIATESVGTANENFLRYTGIKIPTGQDFSNIVGRWAKLEASQANFFVNEALEHYVLFGDFNFTNRQELMSLIMDNDKPVYRPDFDTFKEDTIDGRRLFEYRVIINLDRFAELIKLYLVKSGLGDQLNQMASLFEGVDGTSEVIVLVDATSKQVVAVSNSDTTGVLTTQRYSNHNVITEFSFPTKTVSYEELQRSIQQVQ